MDDARISSWNLNNQRVILRVDINIPLNQEGRLADMRLKAIQPSLDYLAHHSAQVCILTHIGNPKSFTPALSTRLLMPWFEQQGYACTFAQTIAQAYFHMQQKTTPFILLENTRFFPGEKGRDLTFARELATLGNYYINDAFGSLHRNDTSLTLLAQLYPKSNRSIGFLVAKEIIALSAVKNSSGQPLVYILGGAKLETKIPLILPLLKKPATIIILPALSFSFDKARNKKIGNSLTNDTLLPLCNEILKKESPHLIFPIDYLVASNTQDGQLDVVDAGQMASNHIGISIGPKTVAALRTTISKAHTVVINGLPGFINLPDTIRPAYEILKMLNDVPVTIATGGDSGALIESYKATEMFDFISTGGGSALAFLANQPLPSLEAL